MDDVSAWVRLTKTGASARRLNTLLDCFGSPEGFFSASPRDVSAAARCSTDVAVKLLDPSCSATQRELDLMEQLGVRLVPRSSSEYPALLKETPDPPVALYVRGTLVPED